MVCISWTMIFGFVVGSAIYHIFLRDFWIRFLDRKMCQYDNWRYRRSHRN